MGEYLDKIVQSAIEREKEINLEALKLCKEATDKLAENAREGKELFVALNNSYSEDIIKVARKILKKDGIKLWKNVKSEMFAFVNTRKIEKAKKLLLKKEILDNILKKS